MSRRPTRGLRVVHASVPATCAFLLGALQRLLWDTPWAGVFRRYTALILHLILALWYPKLHSEIEIEMATAPVEALHLVRRFHAPTSIGRRTSLEYDEIYV